MADKGVEAATFVVVGGGASGVLIAAQLLRRRRTKRVILCERYGTVAAGIAYGTEHFGHLLNVPAGRMSALPDDPGHFYRWLSQRPSQPFGHGWSTASFAPRRTYRDYLSGLLKPHLAVDTTPSRLIVWQSEIIDLCETAEGVEVIGADGSRHYADAAILALGNEEPPQRQMSWLRHGWTRDATIGLPKEATVAIIRTGLSMIDNLVSLLDAGHTGRILAVSRRGLLPRSHGDGNLQNFLEIELPYGRSAAGTLRWLRRCIATQPSNWRGVIDGLRPHTQALWQSLAPVEKCRFLRHARAWWDVHRHRMAPEISARLTVALASGQLSILPARLSGMQEVEGHVQLRVVPRGQAAEVSLPVSRVIDCRGLSLNLSRTGNPLLRALLARGIIRPDACGLGLDVASDGATIDGSGHASDRLYAIGPITVGVFWEIIAIPYIRVHAERLARTLAGDALIVGTAAVPR